MRISDWSSDVCSSDLRSLVGQHDRADLFVLVGAFDRPLGLAVEWRTPRVAPLLLVIGDDRDGPTLFVADMFVCHPAVPRWTAAPASAAARAGILASAAPLPWHPSRRYPPSPVSASSTPHHVSGGATR